ncbi:MAG TPA: tetratricopeptide repeat protein, partial [Terriglobales bacterium]|nr:tetratricopeptide repeat protein [Terriglobales bacterium]
MAIAATALLITCAGAQQANKELRKRAFELYDQHRVEQALPLLEKLADANPKDVQVLEALGMAILHRSSVAKDVEACRREKARARKVLLQAKELGDNSNLLQVVLEGLPENAECKPYSDRSEADESMRKAEAAFGRGDLDEALRWYVQTTVLDPNNYHAALYAGDAYFKKGQYGSSGEWYARAIQIDPNQPTAYRYWGDSLMRAGKLGEARHKFVDAVVVAPFLQASWIGLRQWADRAGYDLVNPRNESPLKETEKDGAKTITIDAGGLKEEAAALAAVANAATEGIASGRLKQVDASLSNLLRLRDKGLIEPYGFIARGDAGIANDYEGYRRQHAEKVRQYIEEEVLLPKLTDEAERRADG